jgi:Fic-DOC domain mobile mystery protein B
MGLKFEYPEGATPLDPDDAFGLIPSHINTHVLLNRWEHANIARGEEWAFSIKRRRILTIGFLQLLHSKMFGDTWKWAGHIRVKEARPVGSAPENIRPELKVLLADVEAQIEYESWGVEEIAMRFHHRLVQIHPFPNGNGRFSRTMTDLLLHKSGRERFVWGADLERKGEARERYITALQAADGKDYSLLFELLCSNREPSRRC